MILFSILNFIFGVLVFILAACYVIIVSFFAILAIIIDILLLIPLSILWILTGKELFFNLSGNILSSKFYEMDDIMSGSFPDFYDHFKLRY